MTETPISGPSREATGTCESRMPSATLEILARSLQREGVRYGFSKLDFIRFVNVLLDLAFKDPVRPTNAPEGDNDGDKAASPRAPVTGLPCAWGRVKLRHLQRETDSHLMARWLEDPHGRYFRLSCGTARYHTCEELLATDSSHFAVITLDDETPIGSMAYLDHDAGQNRAELRKLIGEPSARGQGYAKEATQLWIQYGFDVLGLRKIYLHTLDTALRNIRLNESLGFAIEGILRNEIVLDGDERDVLRMGLCRQPA